MIRWVGSENFNFCWHTYDDALPKNGMGVIYGRKAEGLIKLFKPRDFETLPIFVKTFKPLHNILLPFYLRGDEIQNQ